MTTRKEKFVVGDKVRVTLRGMQKDVRRIPAHMGFTSAHMAYRKALIEIRRAGTIGVVIYVFPSGSLNVDCAGTTYHMEPHMVEKAEKE